ncbi:MAG: hypothetical protein QM569_14870 [Acidovorax sp.]|uniref:hypothetical protein n=1 Tax=Acidovorax sp. TaxID=1872122 RepID=UPI0039E38400
MSATPNLPPENDKGKSKELTTAEAAKRVQRQVIEVVDEKDGAGKPGKVERVKRVPVKADEVLSFRDYGTHVVVVTTDGQKLSSLASE